jgi:tagatose 1,6-diphosphate aldolase
MIAEAVKSDLVDISDEKLSEFKVIVSEVLSTETSAILLDPEYGLEASRHRAPGCGLLLAYEMDGYENPRPHRMLALLPHQSVRRLANLGAQGIKILLHYAPRDSKIANDQKHALIERIGSECTAMNIPFFLEPVVYDPEGMDQRSPEFARMKPDLVCETIEEFSRDIYQVDVLKVEFPIIAAYVEGTPVFKGHRVHSLRDALAGYRAADQVARRPYIYLSAGVSSPEFLQSLQFAIEAKSRFSGVLCGRSNWQGGVHEYARSAESFHPDQLRSWLQSTGLRNVAAINQLLVSATPWQDWYEASHS